MRTTRTTHAVESTHAMLAVLAQCTTLLAYLADLAHDGYYAAQDRVCEALAPYAQLATQYADRLATAILDALRGSPESYRPALVPCWAAPALPVATPYWTAADEAAFQAWLNEPAPAPATLPVATPVALLGYTPRQDGALVGDGQDGWLIDLTLDAGDPPAIVLDPVEAPSVVQAPRSQPQPTRVTPQATAARRTHPGRGKGRSRLTPVTLRYADTTL